MTRIKICGLRRQEDIFAVNQAMPDYCGFIIEVPKSRRSVSRDQVRGLVKDLRPEIQPVGVFVNAPVELAAELLEEGTIALAQLHGQEDESYIRRLRELTGKPLIQAFSVGCAEDVQRALASTADEILLDQGGGGTGKPFDWKLVPELPRRFFLAGGLGTENLEAAIRQLHPCAVDLSSGVETDGFKDPAKIRQAVELVRSISQAEQGRE
jgi:phosphoribosylanthranilate isomerase